MADESQVYVYSIGQVIFTWAGIQLLELHKDSKIIVKAAQDLTGFQESMDGLNVIFSHDPRTGGTIEFECAALSRTSKLIAAKINTQRLTKIPQIGPTSITDLLGRRLWTSKGMGLQRVPDTEMGVEAGSEKFMLIGQVKREIV